MITAAQIQELLTGNGAFQFVGGAGDFASAAEQLRTTRSAFVMPPVEKASQNTTGTQVVRQRSVVAVRIVLGFVVRSATKADQSGDVDTTREALKTALVGWTPDPTVYAPMTLVATQALAAGKDGTTVFYACDFSTTYYVRAIPA
ncbi:MAG: phage tail terminator protein [Rhizomicrobium sp.]